MKTIPFFCLLTAFLMTPASIAFALELPEEMQKIMDQEKYDHALWGVYVKDTETGKVLYDLNANKLFSPASTTKLFSVSALLHAFGDNYRFKTPVYASGKIEDGVLQGDLILVAQGDLTMGGRETPTGQIAYTKMDHTIANDVPGVILTKEDPLHGLNALAEQVSQKGIKEIHGNVMVDDSLFEIIEKRGMILTPILINENFIDIVINPTQIGQKATLAWRPKVSSYSIDNQVTTVAKDEALKIEIISDDAGHRIFVQGTIPMGQEDLVRTFSIKDPKVFAQKAFIDALERQGIKIHSNKENSKIPDSYENFSQMALWTSPPLFEYAKLILKVSHNLGADLIPLLLASQKGEKTFDQGMRLFGDFVTKEVKISSDSFVFIDGAGGNENRLTPQAELQLLDYARKQKPATFQHFFDALPILGVDGSLENFAKNTPAVGKVRAKPGTGVSANLATGKLFLITQALTGYIEGKDGHLLSYIVIVNNATMPTIDDVFAIFEDESQLSNILYEHSRFYSQLNPN